VIPRRAAAGQARRGTACHGPGQTTYGRGRPVLAAAARL